MPGRCPQLALIVGITFAAGCQCGPPLSPDGGEDAGVTPVDAGPTFSQLTSTSSFVLGKVGDGGWQRLASDGGVHRLELDSSGQYTFVERTTTAEGRYVVNVICASASEATRWVGSSPSPAVFRVSGQATGLGANDRVAVAMRGSFVLNVTAAAPAYTLASVVKGKRDLLALRFDEMTNLPTLLAARRGVQVDSELTGIDFDFAQPSAMPLVPHAFTVKGGVAFGQLVTASGSAIGGIADSSVYMGTWYGPATDPTPGDNYFFFSNDSNDTRGIMRSYPATTNPGDLTFDLSAVATLSGVAMEAVGPPTLANLSYAPPAGAPPLNAYNLTFFEPDGASWSALVTAGCMAGATRYTLPDLAAVPDWPASASLSPNVAIQWQAQVLLANHSAQAIAEADQLASLTELTLYWAAQRGYGTFR